MATWHSLQVLMRLDSRRHSGASILIHIHKSAAIVQLENILTDMYMWHDLWVP